MASNDPHCFYCVICNRDVSCLHQGKADVERHIASALHEGNMKKAEGQCKLQFVSKQDPFGEKLFTYKYIYYVAQGSK